ncbi:MAG: SHOCT domain-containing protein [Deltaproteobacteria bacterium]|nr:SHOCT domain-containing protein [Deltaproteobacteria bacterium]MCB9488551.1 SHOCT domain-containing protein [Deltaproteobacteria bacterium]
MSLRIRGNARRLLILALAALMVSSCTKAGIKSSEVYRDDLDVIELAWETDKDGNVVEASYDHPAQVDEKKLAAWLSSLTYSEYVFFEWRKKNEVFDDQEVAKLAKPVSQALAKATSNQWVRFEVTSYKRDLLFKSKRLATGWFWVEDGRLNLVLGNFRLELHKDEEAYPGDPRSKFSLMNYKLDPGSFYGPPAVEPSDDYRRKEHDNWLVVDVAALPDMPVKTDAAAAPAPTPTPVLPQEERTTAERLQELQNLHDQGLISDEEFEAKRREILDEL